MLEVVALKAITRFLEVCVIAGALCFSAQSMAEESGSAGSADQAYNTVMWTDLIPPEELEILMNPPQWITEIEDGSEEDQIASQISNTLAAAEDDRYQQALVSTNVNAEMNGALVRVPGFVVPLEFDEEQVITQFFLVPYFGACLHMPPPPPNQIILVDSPSGLQLDQLYTPFWISGKLSTSVTENEMATAAYSLTMASYEVYEE